MRTTLIDNRYTLVELLGGGGMAEVYLAHDEILDRRVALKVLRQQYAEDEEFVERFRREARSAASLSHPNIVPVYDQGRSEDGAYYIAMEYVPGGTLKERIQRAGALAPDEATGISLQIADALRAAHEKGVIHRDIKPHNVLITETGSVKVTDFGIARAASSPATATSAVLGTAGYMSPEQAMGKAVGPRSDLYSLGVVFYEMLTGELPYSAEAPVAVAMKHVTEPPRSPRDANPNVPEALDALTVKLLAKDPEDRYPTAAALADDLERVRHGLLPTAASPGRTEHTTTPLPPSAKGRASETVVDPPTVAKANRLPKLRKRRWGRLFRALRVLLLGVALLGGLVWALTRDSAEPGQEGSKDTSDAEETAISSVLVPKLVYASEAEGVLAGAGLKLGGWNETPSDTISAGVVIEQDPAEGTEVEEGTTVDIVVSTGPQQPPTVQATPALVSPAPPPPAQDEKAAKRAKEERKRAAKRAEEDRDERGKGKQKGKKRKDKD